MGKEQRVTGSPRVEAGVGVKESISLDENEKGQICLGRVRLGCVLPCSPRPGDCSNRQLSHRFQCSRRRTIHYTSNGAHDQSCCRESRRRVGQIS